MRDEALRALSPERVDELTVRVFRTAWRARPEVRLIEADGERAVVKDYGRSGTWVKRLVGAYLACREAAALRRAEGIENIPRLLAKPSAWSLVTEHIEAEQVTQLEAPRLERRFFERLTEMIRALHRRGIAHGDIEKLDNILITPAGEPALVDFAAAIMGGTNPVAALALPHVQENDIRGIHKLKESYAPELLTEADREFLHSRGAVERLFRRARVYVRSPVKALSSRRAGGPGGTEA